MLTRLPADKLLEQVRQSVAWICTTYLQDSVYRLFATETASETDPAAAIASNSQGLSGCWTSCTPAPSRWPISFSRRQRRMTACYALLRLLPGCHRPRGSQAFVAGVFQKVLREQNCVSWTPRTLSEDAQDRTRATYYLLAACILTALWLLLLVYLLTRN